MNLFGRYVLSEILPPLVGALVAVILLFLLAGLEEVIGPLLAKGASPLLVARLLALSVPEALSRALPIGLMFATLLGLSRLAADSEIKGALAGGVPVTELLRPVLTLALGVTALSFLIGEGLRPRAYSESLKVQQQIVFDNPRVTGLGQAAEDGQAGGGQTLVLTDALNRAISVGEVRPGGELRDLRIVAMQAGEAPREVITAESGTLVPGSNVLELRRGQRVTYQSARPVTVLTFQSGRLPVQDVQASFAQDERSSTAQAGVVNLPLRELWSRTQAYRQQQVPAPAEFTAFHRKIAEPLAALALAFFAVSLAVFSFRGGLNLGLTWAILLAFAYYATWSVFRIMGENGGLPPVVAAYAPDLIAVLAGLALLWRSERR
ncbi:LptF/LptG family permease [Deinococcus wulumuqiensis]|uniref:Permease n=1 Tax=Deinococcus wulumuqiensis TaxID=980427 RepID=A0A345II87_9DEIO|nr:LptF/LptG family permease [Deinococcus wulumuqiensis]AXG99409.1 YjgP/YjgQ family permease [Deinococcus wulumuqiensis]QII21933.1 YjgP/YjgQ family permease [Deinococcus wulumuqiensis R12]GGI84862.1 permease [Deinococcus wulumuqiensis]GGP29898.1 permease [Deinococcus wulumuqiensis]